MINSDLFSVVRYPYWHTCAEEHRCKALGEDPLVGVPHCLPGTCHICNPVECVLSKLS